MKTGTKVAIGSGVAVAVGIIVWLLWCRKKTGAVAFPAGEQMTPAGEPVMAPVGVAVVTPARAAATRAAARGTSPRIPLQPGTYQKPYKPAKTPPIDVRDRIGVTPTLTGAAGESIIVE